MKFDLIKLFYRITCLGVLLIGFTPVIYAQIYGLRFQGQDVTLDKRTELNLSPDGYLDFQNEFEISFDYKIDRIKPNSTFGYIFRIVNSKNQNIDLLSTPSPVLSLNIVAGKSNSITTIAYPEKLMGQWVKLKVKFLLHEDRLIFYTPDTFCVSGGIGFNKQDEFKIIFGANDYQQFKTTDVPAMSVKNLQIYENGILKYFWPFDEAEGNVATDKLNKQEAKVINPVWLKLTHNEWKNEFDKELDGSIVVAFDEKTERIFMLGTGELSIYSAKDNSFIQKKYSNQITINPNGANAIFNSADNKIYCYNAETGPMYIVDTETGEAVQKEISQYAEKVFRHHNGYYNHADNSVYLFGGYGFHRYNGEIRKIDLNTMSIENYPGNDSVYFPRYLAGAGELNDTVYIFGGYGSNTGDQLINPHSYYDLVGYSLKTGSLFKKFEVGRIIDDMVLANSLWIDPATRKFYGLIFEKSRFDGYLQLVKGNLNTPEIEVTGTRIPFQFLDVRSFATLFYMPDQKKLYAYTSYLSENDKTHTAIYSISYPPNSFNIDNAENRVSKGKLTYVIIAFVMFLAAILLFVFRKRKGLKNENSNKTGNPIGVRQDPVEITGVSTVSSPYKFVLFGGFQIYNKKNEDVTSWFSPLLKELFLLILLHSFKNNKGISSEKLTEILWFDKSEKSARNNRAVNIAKLKGFLEEIGSCELSKKTGYWKIDFEGSHIKSDYFDFLNITSSGKNLTKQKIEQLIDITQKGGFLVNEHYEWLDEFKSMVADKIVDTLVEYGQKADIKAEADFVIHLADCIFNFDVVNEEAMILKCKAQYCLGKHSHAKQTYEKFNKEFVTIYNQEYEKSFTTIINYED